MYEHDGPASLQLVEQWSEARVPEVAAAGVAEQHDAVQPQVVEGIGQFGERPVDVGQRQAGEPAEPVGTAPGQLGGQFVAPSCQCAGSGVVTGVHTGGADRGNGDVDAGRCDVFVHCAAAFDQVTLADVDAGTWRHVQAVNVESALWLTQAVTPGMTERHFGRIVFITSDTFWAPPPPALLAYVASKGALLGVMRTLAVTLGADGIAVSAVAPGLTDTPASRVVNTDEQFDATVDRQALKRRLTPDDTAAAVAYLASDMAAAMTGQVLCADGGLIMR